MQKAVIKFTIKSFYRIDDYVYVIGYKIICDNVRMKKDIRKQMEIRGHFPISLAEDDQFEAEVEKKINGKDSSTYLEIIGLPKRIGLEKADALAQFLRKRINAAPKNNPKLEKWKISLNTCNKIVSYLGLDAINKITNNPIQLLNYDDLKLNDDKVFELQSILQYYIDLQKSVMLLQTSNIKTSLIYQLSESYGNKLFQVLHDNPYQICYEGKISFNVADKLALDANIPMDNSLRIKTAILDFMRYQENENGHICILREHFIHNKKGLNLNTYLDRNGAFKKNNIPNDKIFEMINELIQEKKLILEEDFGTQYIYTPTMHQTEEQLVSNVNYLLTNTYNQKFCDDDDIEQFLIDYEQKTGFVLDILQKKAVKNSLQNKLTILTGGPGTGKTATVSVIVDAIKEISKKKYNRLPDIRLTAPTGKAAERMTELTNEPAYTLHRMLGLGYLNGSPDEVDADFIIVDESSMIDIFLMTNLLSALTEKTRILFVGDVNQLPSVGPGKILSDFISSGKIKYVQLKTIFRQAQGSAIVSNANKVISGLTSNMPNGIDLSNDSSKNFKFLKCDNTQQIKLNIISKLEEYFNNGVSLAEICILTAARKGEIGVENLNTIFQDRYNHNPILFENEELGIAFKIGDKIIQNVNNYDLGVFNGYIGEIIDINPNHIVNGRLSPTITVSYNNVDYDVVYEGDAIYELELAYALTVHKSQGSEYPYVISPISLEQNILLNRNLLYTDITRAKKEFCLIGDETAVNKAISTEISDEDRISRISYKIATRC